MTDSTAADAAIKKLLQTYQELADQERKQAPLREAAMQKVDQLVDDLASIGAFDASKVSTDMMAAYAVFERQIQARLQMGDMSAQMQMAKFNRDFIKELAAHFKNMQQDPARFKDFRMAFQELTRDMTPPRIQLNTPTIDIAISEPEGNTGKWTLAVVPLIVDDKYNVKVADKLDFDLYLSAEITPHQSLTSEFNIPGKMYKAGQKVEPLIVSHETTENGPQTMVHVRGHIYKDGAYVQPLEFPPLPLEKQQPMGMDMEAIMRMLGGGGPGGPKLN